MSTSAIEIQKDGVVFTANPNLCGWVEAEEGRVYGLNELESIVVCIKEASPSAHRVELYGVPEKGLVYAKMFNATSVWEEVWRLEFTRLGKRITRVTP